MFMQKTKKNLILFAFIILTFISIVLTALLSNVSYTNADCFDLSNGWRVEVNDTVYENIALDGYRFPMLGKGDTLKMSLNLSDAKKIETPALLVYTIHSDIEVRYNNQTIYTYGQSLLEENKLLGYGYHLINLPAEYNDADLELIMHISEDDAFSSIRVPQIYNSTTFFRDFTIKNLIPLAVNMFLIVFGILVVFVSLIFCFYNKRFFKLVCVGIFSFGIGCWSLCSYDLIILFTYDPRIKAILEFAALYISPLFVLLYFWKDKFVTRNKFSETVYKILLTAQICFAIIAFSMQLTNLLHFPAVLKYQHLILLFICISVIAQTIYDIIKNQLQNKSLILGITAMLIIGLSDIIRFFISKYLGPSGDANFTSHLCVGALLFVLSELADFCLEIMDILVKGAQTQVLEQMAYIDDMTGVANRRRCEELWDNLDKHPGNYGIFSFDLNNLKKANDTRGHAFGDLLIQTFAHTLSKVFDKVGVVGRLGGDEFLVVIPDMGDINLSMLTRQLEKEIAQANNKNPELNLSTAYGFCSHEEHPDYDARKIYRQADANMYEHKMSMKAMRTG